MGFKWDSIAPRSGYMGRRSSMSPGALSPKLDRQRESSSSPSHRSSRQIQPQRFVPGLPGFGLSSRGAMEDFRTKLLEKFTTIKEAMVWEGGWGRGDTWGWSAVKDRWKRSTECCWNRWIFSAFSALGTAATLWVQSSAVEPPPRLSRPS